ncbi:hypothetical protein EYF80_020487 [Liparis tanakae]|uniref:Uncharacterized protein n=1 Tax=Liparis tanakae TaxID=230148 RepID=A0A4Z2HU22_9TELE|nr:hypothetical protein EYF80_020487 [Liparis tanakae]
MERELEKKGVRECGGLNLGVQVVGVCQRVVGAAGAADAILWSDAAGRHFESEWRTDRIVVVNEAMNRHEQSIQPPTASESKVPRALRFLSHL